MTDSKSMEQYSRIRGEAEDAVNQLLEQAHMEEGDILVVGCSSSEVNGMSIGKGSDLGCAKAVYEGIQAVIKPRGIYLAAQCCEHLNRAIITEKAALLPGTPIANVLPQPHAGGSFAMTVYENAEHPVALEHIQAQAGMDIGDTLIGMHLQDVAVPVRIKVKAIGGAHVVCARTRPKYIGGERAVYDKNLSGGDIER